MTVLLLLCGLIAVGLPSIRPRRLLAAQPRWCVRLATAALSFGIANIVTSLALSVSIGVIRLFDGSPLLAMSHLAPEGRVGSLVAAMLLAHTVVAATRLAAAAQHSRRAASAASWFGVRHERELDDVLILPDDGIIAYAIPGNRPQIVISKGLRDQVDDDLFRFVIDHERAHLSARDHHALVVALAVEALLPIFPWAGRSAATVRIAVERAADEQAAGREPARRRQLAGKIDALGRVPGATCLPEMLQFRSRQLLMPPGGQRSWLLGAAIGVAAVAAAATGVAIHAATDAAPLITTL